MQTIFPLLLLLAAPNDEAFRAGVRPTEPLSPEQQQKSFHLPSGFEIQLVAAEPDIQKPMNLAFDAAGRLWMTGSVEYPYAAAGRKGRDAIKVLEDTDGDGRADKITTFADDLNIPIGLYPYRDGVVAYSMPNIWFLRDTDGDGRADQREVLYRIEGPPRDTHGMQNAFRRGFDGWLYVNHGFANESTITARDGNSIKLQSGNTYRLRLDGSRVEQFTWGQVNPFGSAFLPDGDIITADCHSKPLTLLLRGAYYTSFGKPHDGLGFAPDLLGHDHGSTAICGVVHVTGDHFPPEYRRRLLVGNVMTSRVNHDMLQYTGSSPRAIEQPDFVTTDDPWFRPVDLQIGPDGALYIADFYNRIIGHYEVSLEHPGRDKHRARIWRVVYRGPQGDAPLPKSPNLATAEVTRLIEHLASSNLTVRTLATDQLTDRIGAAAAEPLAQAAEHNDRETVRVHAAWALARLNKLPATAVEQLSQDRHELVRLHAQRIAGTHGEPSVIALIERGLRDDQALVRRAAAESAGVVDAPLLRLLLDTLQSTAADDPMLRHVLRIAIRNQLRRDRAWATLRGTELPAELRALLADIALGIANEDAASFLFDALRAASPVSRQLESRLAHLAVNLPPARLGELIGVLRENVAGDVDLQSKLLLIMHQRLQQRGLPETVALQGWGGELTKKLLASATDAKSQWTNRTGGNPWGLEPRACADGQRAEFLSSLPGGESATAKLRSQTFVIPPRMSFYLCGHLGFPTAPAAEKNFVQLRLIDSDSVVQMAMPPRNDVAQRIDWDLAAHAGKQAYLEIVDGLDLDAYAWLAVARFDPPVVDIPAISPAAIADRQVAACQIAVALQLNQFADDAKRLLLAENADWRARGAAALAVIGRADRSVAATLAGSLTDPAIEARWREEICRAIAAPHVETERKLLVAVMQSAPAKSQRQIADGLAATKVGGTELLGLVERGHAAARLLQDAGLRQKLAAARIDDLDARLAKLTAGLPPANAELQRLIDERRTSFSASSANLARGGELFRKHCAACHQVKGHGALVGPQLDGIGNRGAERVVEDVLDPNRNIDATFHVSILSLDDGRVVTGLIRREEGQNLILANQEGKEIAVAMSDIAERKTSPLSLMPANVAELLKPDEFHDLLGFLLEQRAAEKKGQRP